MGILLFLLFTAVPIAEIFLLIRVGGEIGAIPTIGLVILTAVVGAALIRMQGFATLARAQASMEKNEMPVGALFDGLCLLVAGALLLTPGFVTDTFGFLLLVPPFRKFLAATLGARLMARATIRTRGPGGAGDSAGRRPGGDPEVIDGDYTDVTETRETPPADPPELPGRGWGKEGPQKR